MIIETKRKLENNVFSTNIMRIEKDGDESIQIEAKLENDFGPVVIKTGGIFSANVTGTSSNLVVTPVFDNSESNFKFCVNINNVEFKKGSVISFSCDASKQTPMKINEIELSPLMIAEQRCRVFEAIIKKRIEDSVNEWKKQQTNFEDEIIENLEISLLR